MEREYNRYFSKSRSALETAIDAYNRVYGDYRTESCLMLLTNAWELLAKAILLKKKQLIIKNDGDTISAADAIEKLRINKDVDECWAACVQQIISLRHEAVHSVLPSIPPEVAQHLLFFGCKFYREAASRHFGRSAISKLSGNYLTLSFDELTTYADKISKSISRIKKDKNMKHLVWLLERGVSFSGGAYMRQDQFEKNYFKSRKVMPLLKLKSYIDNSEMVKVVAVQAPKGYAADVQLRKGDKKDNSLPVVQRKIDIELEYPFFTQDIANELGRSLAFVSKAVRALNLIGDPQYHASYKTSSKGHSANRYTKEVVVVISNRLKNDPSFNPYTKHSQGPAAC